MGAVSPEIAFNNLGDGNVSNLTGLSQLISMSLLLRAKSTWPSVLAVVSPSVRHGTSPRVIERG
jgi:hypothetical protein